MRFASTLLSFVFLFGSAAFAEIDSDTVLIGECALEAAKIAEKQLDDRAVAGHRAISSGVDAHDASKYIVEFEITDEFGQPGFDEAITVNVNPRTCFEIKN